MNDEEYQKRFMDAAKRKYREIGAIVMPVMPKDLDDEAKLEFSIELLAGQSAICTSMSGNIVALTKSGMVPQDLGEQLLLASRQLSIDMQKAIQAAAILAECPDSELVPPTVH